VSMHHRRRYTARRLLGQFDATKWEPLVRSYYYSAMLPGVAAVRLARRRRAHANGNSDLALAPPVLNTALQLPVRAEAKLIERGVRLPAGVSIGTVCRPR
jgi:hypothetical protein